MLAAASCYCTTPEGLSLVPCIRSPVSFYPKLSGHIDTAPQINQSASRCITGTFSSQNWFNGAKHQCHGLFMQTPRESAEIGGFALNTTLQPSFMLMNSDAKPVCVVVRQYRGMDRYNLRLPVPYCIEDTFTDTKIHTSGYRTAKRIRV